MVIANEEVEGWIKEMDYVTVEEIKYEPSYYKLKDGTIIKAHIHINHLKTNPRAQQGFSVNSTNMMISYVPKEKLRPDAYQPYSQAELQAGIIDDDMEPEVLRENFSVYKLSNGMTLSVKTIAGQVSKTKFFTQDGEPIYVVNTTPIIKVKKKPE
ncbi:MAG: hypothetical protein IIC67_08140 [Thaumarchaeota archaeon]|nr:hypothetical protein [Nitrososphaerota archaeon]